MRNAATNDQFTKNAFYPAQKQSEVSLRTSSPPNEDTGEGYFLPDFITDEIENKSPTAQTP